MSKQDIEKVIESASFMNPPHHSGYWETACRSVMFETEHLVRAYASGDRRAVRQWRYEIERNIKSLDSMLADAYEMIPIKYHCTDCGATWRGPNALNDALAAPCRPYDDEVRPRAHHTMDLLQELFDRDEPVQPLQNPPPADNATAADGPSQDDEQPLTEAEKHSEGISDSEAYWHELDDHDRRAYDADAADLNAERRALHYGDESPPSIEDLRYEAAERRFLRSAEREQQQHAEEFGEPDEDDPEPMNPEDLIW